MSNYQITNRRGGERRKQFTTPQFPFYDTTGHMLERDRRFIPDRRLGSITVEWINEEEIITDFTDVK
jgi:hypothetical protein